MGDRTHYQARVELASPPSVDQHRQFTDIIERHFGQIGWEDLSGDAGYEQTLGAMDSEHSIGDAGPMADELHEAFPDAQEVLVWADPAYEWLGTLVRWRGEERFEGQCDADGNVVLTEPEIRLLLEVHAEDLAALREALLVAIGGEVVPA